MWVKDFKELIVWQKGVELVVDVYRLTKTFPKEEIYGLVSQIRRAVVSIPVNISEGYSRNHTKEFIQFLYVSLGSASEVETLLILSNKLKFVCDGELKQYIDKVIEVKKILCGLLNSLNKTKLSTIH